MGTPEFAVPILEMLIEKYEVIMVVTQPDKLVGRKQILTASPIKQLAAKYQIPVYQPNKIRKDYEKIVNAKPDIIITCAYGQIVPEQILNAPKHGCINVHASLLPKYRGGAPIHKAIMNGEKETGVTIMYMDKGMDTGDMIAKSICAIEENDNVGTLHDKLAKLGRSLLEKTLPSIIEGTNQREKQDHSKATYAYNVKREEEHLDFTKSGKEIINQIRGLYPWPLANFLLKNEEVKALEAYFEKKQEKNIGVITVIKKDAIGISCKDGIIYITRLKPFGKKAMDTKSYLNGMKKEELLNQSVE